MTDQDIVTRAVIFFEKNQGGWFNVKTIYHPDFEDLGGVHFLASVLQKHPDLFMVMIADLPTFKLQGPILSDVKKMGAKQFVDAYWRNKDMKEQSDLAARELSSANLIIAKRVIKSYNSTRFIAWAGFVFGLFSFILAILSALKAWPFG